MRHHYLYQSIFLFLCCLLSACSDGEKLENKENASEGMIVEYSPEGTLKKKDDIKVQVASAVASSCQKGMDIALTIDGKRETLYNAGWDITVENYFPVIMDYYFEDIPFLDYCIYYPRLSGSNGNFENVEVWYQTYENEEFNQIVAVNLNGSSNSSIINFSEQIKKPKVIRFIIREKVSGNGAPVCSEMEFYQRGDVEFDAYTIFADKACTTLKSGITEDELQAIPNVFFRNMALSIFNKNYPDTRIREYKPYITPDVLAEKYKTGTYSLRDNPTGIYVGKDENLVVMVEELHQQNVSLVVQNLERGFEKDSDIYTLINGVNVLSVKNSGLVYVMYYTNTGEEIPVKINIASGKVNGVFKKGGSDLEWKKTLDNTIAKHLDIIGEHAHLTFPVESFKAYCNSGSKLLDIYDEIVRLEKEFMGLEIPNHMYFIVTYKEGVYMQAAAYRTEYHPNTMKKICDEKQLVSNIWGPAHEVGHVNQIRPGLKWAGTTEVTNNIHSLYVQTTFGEKSRLLQEESGYANSYEQAYHLILGPHVPHAFADKSFFAKLVPFWQLQLYYAKVKGKVDYYRTLYTLIRETDNPPTHGDSQLQFVKKACIAANEDLTDFFEKWGFLSPVNMFIDDYGAKEMLITQTQIKNIKEEIRNLHLPSPTQPIEYITDENWQLFQSNTTLETGSILRNGRNIQMLGWTNAIAYEVYSNGKLVQVSQLDRFILVEGVDEPEIFVVNTSGNRIKATV